MHRLASCCLRSLGQAAGVAFAVVGKAGIAKGYNSLTVVGSELITQHGDCPMLPDEGCPAQRLIPAAGEVVGYDTTVLQPVADVLPEYLGRGCACCWHTPHGPGQGSVCFHPFGNLG